jgi:hypothetical protein
VKLSKSILQLFQLCEETSVTTCRSRLAPLRCNLQHKFRISQLHDTSTPIQHVHVANEEPLAVISYFVIFGFVYSLSSERGNRGLHTKQAVSNVHAGKWLIKSYGAEHLLVLQVNSETVPRIRTRSRCIPFRVQKSLNSIPSYTAWDTVTCYRTQK